MVEIKGQEGWKSKYTLKEWKQNKAKLKELAGMLPSPVFISKITKVPGFELLTLGIEYFRNDRVIPWYEYPITSHEQVDHEEMIKNIFMDRGMDGLMNYINADIPMYLSVHTKQFPDLYRNQNTN